MYMNVRFRDFGGWCNDVPRDECYAPLSAIARRVEEVQEELLARKRIAVDRVIVTSDEQDNAWWEEVYQLGWTRPDHSRTVEQYGEWYVEPRYLLFSLQSTSYRYPILIDAAIQSGGLGFVGTDMSTVSLIARKRVVAWNGGSVRTVRWGHLGADEH
jgi:hypothetical protein